MLNKNDPLVGAIQDVMRKNQAERDAVKAVNEKFGVQDRRVLPREKQSEWDDAYQSVLTEGLHPNQQKLDVHEPEKDKLTKHDFKMLRSKKKPMEEENKAESSAYAIGTAAVNKSTGDEPPMEKKNITKAHEIAKKILAKKKMNEGFNDRHDSSVTASVEGQVVADQLNERVSFSPADQKARGNIVKDINSTNARLAREPAVAPSSIGTKVSNAIGAVDAGVRKFAQGMGGDYVAAAGDYAVKNVGAKLGIGQGTTYAKELGQEKEKSARAELNHPTATKIGKAADDISTVAGIAGLAKSGVKYGAKKLIQKSADDTVAATTKTLPSSTKSVSQAAKEPAASAATKGSTAVDNFISKAKSTPVTPAAREGGSAASTAAANAAKYNKSSTAGGRFSDNLAKARKGSENYGPSKGGVAVRKTTEPATVTRPGVPAVANKPGVPAVANRPGVPAVANRPGLPARVGASSGAKVAGRTSNLKDIGTKALVGLGVGAAMYGLSNKNKPDSTQAGTPPVGGGGGSGGGSTSTKTQSTAKPGTQQAVKDRVAQKVATRSKEPIQTRNQRDDTIGASGRSTKGPGGVTSGTKTGKIITNRPAVVKKNPVGMGRVK